MNRFSLILTLAALIASAACSSTKHREVVDFSGIGEPSDSRNVAVRFNNVSGFSASDSDRVKPGQTETFEANDNSKIIVMRDKFGNKTEIRTFANHPRLSSVLLLTGTTGRREAFIYGRGGETVSASEEILEGVLSASADEIANAAKIYQTFPQGNFIYTQKPQEPQPLKPLPSSEFPLVNNQTAEPPPVEQPVEESEQPTDTAEQKPTAQEPEKPTASKTKTKDGEEL